MAYTPEYYNQLQQYYAGYLPGQTLNTGGLQNWYASTNNIPYGGTSFAAPSASDLQGLFSSLIEGDGTGEGTNAPSGAVSANDTGLAQGVNVSPAAVSVAAAIGSILGIPFTSLLSFNNQAIAKSLSQMSYNNAVAQNIATIAAQLGLDPNNPENAAAISAAIDTASSFAPGSAAATTGPAGTGAAAAAASAAAAEAAAAAGHSPEAQGAAGQAAANAALSGASPAEAAAEGAAAASAADSGSNDGSFGGY